MKKKKVEKKSSEEEASIFVDGWSWPCFQ